MKILIPEDWQLAALRDGGHTIDAILQTETEMPDEV